MRFFKSLRRKLLSLTLAVILSVLGGWFMLGGGTIETQIVSAGSTDNLSGYAWSSNIGWVSFNCMNEGTCGTSNYGVHIDESQRFSTGGIGGFSGWAWSSNIGWISFNRGETSNPPSDDIGGGSGPIAQVDWTTGNVSGWARALAGCQNVPGVPVGSCSSSGAGAASGGWDGWIKLRSTGVEPSYGVLLTGNNLSRYAWGGDVVGWISFNCTNEGTCGTSNYGVIFTPIGTPPPAGCGTANGVPTVNPPATNLCSNGVTPTSGPLSSAPATPYTWTWTCANPPNPDASCSAPFPQCSDGIDNDGDGDIDLIGGDTGCSNASDNAERNFQFREF